MNYPLQALINMGAIPPVTFPTDSRYYGSGTLSYQPPGGQPITYLAQRFVPQPGGANYATLATHTVRKGDRTDLLAATYLGDPLLYWVLCDANGVVSPHELVEVPGSTITITMPQGVPGPSHA